MKYPFPWFPGKPTIIHKGTEIYQKLIDDDDWIVEPKKNGKRCIVSFTDEQVRLWSRQGVEFKGHNDLKKELFALVRRQNFPDIIPKLWFDSELEDGILWIFDVQISNNFKWGLEFRRLRLESMINGQNCKLIKYVPWFVGKKQKEKAYDLCLANGDEGIVFKKLDSQYPFVKKPGEETLDWFKIKEIVRW